MPGNTDANELLASLPTEETVNDAWRQLESARRQLYGAFTTWATTKNSDTTARLQQARREEAAAEEAYSQQYIAHYQTISANQDHSPKRPMPPTFPGGMPA